MTTSYLLKGSPPNVSWSLTDMRLRRTKWLKGKPRNWMLWGVNERFKWVLERLPGSTVFLYMTKGAGVAGGLVLYGTAHEIFDLEEPYWPEGEWKKAFYLEVKAAAPKVLEEPENPAVWKLVSRKKLAEIGVKILPGPQKLREREAKLLMQLLEKLR